jgi:hypothetical protein
MNAVTFGGATPLMRAVESGRPEVVHLLLERGADMLPANRKGKRTVSNTNMTRDRSLQVGRICQNLSYTAEDTNNPMRRSDTLCSSKNTPPEVAYTASSVHCDWLTDGGQCCHAPDCGTEVARYIRSTKQ